MKSYFSVLIVALIALNVSAQNDEITIDGDGEEMYDEPPLEPGEKMLHNTSFSNKNRSK